MTADAIAMSVTWFKLGSRHTSKVTGTSFAHILLRDGENLRISLRKRELMSRPTGSIYFWYAGLRTLASQAHALTYNESILFTLNCLHLTFTLLSVSHM